MCVPVRRAEAQCPLGKEASASTSKSHSAGAPQKQKQLSLAQWLWSFHTIKGFVEGGRNEQLQDHRMPAKREMMKKGMYRSIHPAEIAWRSLWYIPQLIMTVGMAAGMSGQGLWVIALLDSWLQLGIMPYPGMSTEWNWNTFFVLVFGSAMGAVVMYHAMAGYLYYKYYIKRRDSAHEWKIQPEVWTSTEVVYGQARLGTLNTFIGSLLSCFYVYRLQRFGFEGTGTKLYGTLAEAGGPVPLLTVFMQFLMVMAWDDACAYYMHRFLHTPFMYRHFHKVHHLYKAPTPYASMALHPVEFFLFTLIPFQTAFLFRQHVTVYLFHLCWILFYTIEDHSGIIQTSVWPWQQNSCFHDDHHKYFHVNFGMTTYFWDWLHGTIRDPKCSYSETTFVGQADYHKKGVATKPAVPEGVAK